MTQVIVYEIDGSQVVMTPVLRDGVTIEQIAAKDVPEGVVYQILDANALPAPPPAFRPLDPSSLFMGLLNLNITPDMVDAVIAAMPDADRTFAKWRWERSQVFMRDDWLIEEMAAAFGKSAEEVDAAWLYAQS